MTDPSPQYVMRLEHRTLLWWLFILTILSGLWFSFVLFGESQNYGDNPGRWAVFPTFVWGLLAFVFAIALLAYALALLTIHERPGRLYRLEDEYAASPTEPTAPSFLQPQEPLPPAEGESPPVEPTQT